MMGRLKTFLLVVAVFVSIVAALALASQVAGTKWSIAFGLAACIIASLLLRKGGNGAHGS